MSGYIISEDDQATLECARDLADLLATQIRTDIPGPQAAAFACTLGMQLRGVLARARLTFALEA